ncbi:hypothetical protein D3C72_1968110 [compost metagenome]
MIVHLLQYFAALNQSLVSITEVIKHRIVVISKQQQVIAFTHVLNLQGVRIRQISKRKFADQHRLARS